MIMADYKEKRTKEYLSKRARPLEEKVVIVNKKFQSDFRPEDIIHEDEDLYRVKIVAGKCPCTKCGHEWMWECEEKDCRCCRQTCT